MSKLFHCEIEYMPSPHLMQLYAGFFRLEQQGVVELKLKPKKYIFRSNPVIYATINHQYKVVYDTQDGLSWITASTEENLKHFQDNYPVDFYFKRSYDARMQLYKPEGCQVFPLGFNYNVHPDENLLHLVDTIKDKFKYIVKTNKPLKFVFNKRFYYAKDFEYYPIKPEFDKILFLSRVWDPNGVDVFSGEERDLRKTINENRIMCLDACKQEFGKRFTGGLWSDYFSERDYKSYTLPISQTNKATFIKRVKEHSICIATTGLYNSIGWKMGEYVAAARAIVTEPLNFEVPGPFEKNKNYLEFTNKEELLESIERYLTDKDLLRQTMKNNYHYYNNYLKPDILVLNSLLTIANHSNSSNSKIPKVEKSTI